MATPKQTPDDVLTALQNEAAVHRSAYTDLQNRFDSAQKKIETLAHLVERQADHLQTLRRRAAEGGIISFKAYHEMKRKHGNHLLALRETRNLMLNIQPQLRRAKQEQEMLDRRCERLQRSLENKVVNMKEPRERLEQPQQEPARTTAGDKPRLHLVEAIRLQPPSGSGEAS